VFASTAALAVYVVVDPGVTVVDPCGNAHGLHTAFPEASVTVKEVAVPFATCHDKVEDCPGVIVLGLAFNVRVNGTDTVTVCGPTLPPGPVAVIEYWVVAVTGIKEEPETGSGPESSFPGISGVIVTDVALVVAHVRVAV
jgi:hypothetical protein